LKAQYLNDLMTITFSYPYSDGFLMWGFWDGAHYGGNAPLFDLNWNLKPGGKPFIDLVFDKWWTPTASLTTDTSGKTLLRGFKGKYKITFKNGDEQFVDTISLKSDLKLTYKQPFSEPTGLNRIKKGKINIFPNPAEDHFTIENSSGSDFTMNMWNLNGQLIKSLKAKGTNFMLETTDFSSGVYLVEISDEENIEREKLIIR